jgi:hypothetical protein
MTLDHAREEALIAISREQRMKPTCGPDDGSDAGPWFYRPAREIDGDHRYAEAPATPSLEIDE